MKIKKVPCDVYSRVVGYFRPLSEWNPAKKSEFVERKTYISGRYVPSRKDMRCTDEQLRIRKVCLCL